MKRFVLYVILAAVCLVGRGGVYAQVRGALDGWIEVGGDDNGAGAQLRRDTINRWWELEHDRGGDAEIHRNDTDSHGADGLNHGADDGHDHGNTAADGHDHADEPPGVLIREMAEAIAAQPGRRVLRSFVGVAPRVGFAAQKGLFAEAGVSIDIYQLGYTEGSEYASFGYSNLRPYLSGDMLLSGKLLGGVKLGVEYIRSTPLVGMALGGDVSFYTDGPRRAVTLAPRLMLSLGSRVELFWAYNFFIHNELRPWIGHHRIGFTMTLDRRFWRRKREAYEDYYNSYPQTP